MKRVLSVCLVAILLLGVFPITVFGDESSGDVWEKKTPPITTVWYDEIGAETIPLDEYPDPVFEREQWLNLNGLWDFQGGTSAFDEPAKYTEQIMVPYPMESALSGIMKYYPYSWYSREFTVPDDWNETDRLLLHFEAVDWKCSVYVNGVEVVKDHKGGYQAFSVDVTDEVSRTGINTLSVKVYDGTDVKTQTLGKQALNPSTTSIYYTSVSGIWGTVWMKPVSEKAYIENMVVDTDIDNSVLGLNFQQAGTADATVDVTITAGDVVIKTVTGLPMDTDNHIDIPRDQLYLWSPESPFLYDMLLQVKVDGEVVDTVKSYFGMRKIERKATGRTDQYGAVQGIYLNNEEYFQLGTLDQGYNPDGLYTLPTDEAIKFEIQSQKDIGLNMIRKHVKLESKRWYYYADKIGMLVWQDQPSSGSAIDFGEFSAEVYEMVDAYRNHPSIAVWILYNEGWGQHNESQTRQLTNTVKAMDPSRLVCAASGWVDYEVGDIIDAHHYPEPWPGTSGTRARVAGEWGGCKAYDVEGHTWMDVPASGSAEEFYETYAKLVEINKGYKKSMGMQATVYTQFTDTENVERNGFYTYDRKVLKMDQEKLFALNQSLIHDDQTIRDGIEDAKTRIALRDESLYSESSWALVESAEEQLDAVAARFDVSQFEIYQAVQAVYAALDTLYEVGSGKPDKTELVKQVRTVGTMDERNYEETGWTALQTALSQARGVVSRSKATIEEVETALQALTAACEALVTLPVDKTELDTQIALCEAKKSYEYTVSSWRPVKTALAAAKEVQENGTATRGQVIDAVEALEKAVEGLVRLDDPTPVRYEAENSVLGGSARAKNTGGFSGEGFVEGLDVIDNIPPNQIKPDWSNVSYMKFLVEVNFAGTYNLTFAYCTSTGTTSYLRVNDSTEYITMPLDAGASWNTILQPEFEVELQAGMNEIWISGCTGTIGNGDWLNADYIEITLVEPTGATKEKLQAAIDSTADLSEDEYTVGSWEVLSETLVAAKEVINDESATPTQIAALIQAIADAVEGLLDVIDYTAIQAIIQEFMLLEEEDYTEGSWDTAYELYNYCLYVESSAYEPTQQEVDDAVADLRAAIDALVPKGSVQAGDVNADGAVDSKDARLVLQYAVDAVELTAAQQTAANVVEDNAIDSKDARAILQIAVA